MTLKINYINKNNTKSRNTAIFLTNSGDKKELTKHFDEKIVKKILNYQNSFKKNKKSVIETINLDLDNKLIIIYIDSNLSSQKTENLGANFFDKLKSNKIDNILIIGSNSKDVKKKINFDEFIHGAELKSYVFDLYKTKKSKTLNLNIVKNSNSIDFKLKSKLDSGKIILQKKVKVKKNETIKSLERKIIRQEHIIYPKSILKIFSF